MPEGLRGNVDVIVSNPPYVRREEYEALPEEVRREPYDALVGGTDVHRRLAMESPHWLAPGGWLAMEVGEDQGEEIRRLLEPMFSEVEVIPDVDFARLSEVLVVVAPPPTPDPEAGPRKALAPARGLAVYR